jgi:hypothetical protein
MKIRQKIAGALGGAFDPKRRAILKGTAAAGALAALPKAAKIAMKPAADELTKIPVGPFHESPYFINFKKDLYDQAFDNAVKRVGFYPMELENIAAQVSKRTGKSLEELGLSGLDEKELAQELLRPEILKDVNTPQAVHLLEDRVTYQEGELEAEKVSGFFDAGTGDPMDAGRLVDEGIRSKLHSFYENKSLDDWVDGKITLNEIGDPDLIEYIKSLEPYNMSRADVFDYIEASVDSMEETSRLLSGDFDKTFVDTVRPANWNELHLVDREAEKKAWEETFQRQKDSEISPLNRLYMFQRENID